MFTSPFQASYWSEPQEVAKLRETISKADKILEKLSQVEYMRKNTQTLLSTIRSSSLTTQALLSWPLVPTHSSLMHVWRYSMKSARARQVHRALSAVARGTLYTNVNVEIRFAQAPTSDSCYVSRVGQDETSGPEWKR